MLLDGSVVCAGPCDLRTCGELDCASCGGGGLRSRSPLILLSESRLLEFCAALQQKASCGSKRGQTATRLSCGHREGTTD